MPELKINSGTMKITSGTVKINPPNTPIITMLMEISHTFLDPGLGTMTARYSVELSLLSSIYITVFALIVIVLSVGLNNTVSYSSGYLFRGEFSKTSDGTFTSVSITGDVPGAVAGDGVVDCWFYMESPNATLAGLSGFTGVETGQPGDTNGRYPLKLSASPSTVVAEDVEWDPL